jgi:excisionase family DNA binding protein
MALKSVQQAADSWGVSVCTVRRLAAAGVVHSVTVGRRRLIPEIEIERIAAMGVPGRAELRKPKKR